MSRQSRSVLEFMRRHGLVPTPKPGARLSPAELLINKYETGNTEEKAQLAMGPNPPDNAGTFPWPPAESESSNEEEEP